MIYARYSAGPHQTDQSIEGQVADCTRYAEAHELTVVNVYSDHHVSGKSTEGRDQFLRMIDDAKKGLFDAVIVWKVDRFGRDRRDIAIYKHALKKAGVKLYYAAESVPEGPEGILLESLLEGMAEYYSADLKQKVTRGIRESAKKGQWPTGVMPFGYMKNAEKKPVPDPEKAPIVREVFQRYAAGEPGANIVQDLTRRGVKTNSSTIYRWLRNERYLGHWCILDVPVEVEPLITEEEFMAVQKQFKTSRNRADLDAHAYVLSGKCICGLCGRPVQGASGTGKSGQSFHYYRCAGRKDKTCDLRQFRAEALEDRVLAATTEVMLTDAMVDELVVRIMQLQEEERARSEVPRLEKALADVEKRRKNILKAIEMGVVDDDLNKRLAELKNEAIDLQGEIARENIKKPLIPEDALRQWLISFRSGSVTDDAFCDRMVRTFIDSVTLVPDHAVVAFNATEPGVGLCSTELHELDFMRLRTNTPEVFWPFILLRVDL